MWKLKPANLLKLSFCLIFSLFQVPVLYAQLENGPFW